jgi:hypothetical protein
MNDTMCKLMDTLDGPFATDVMKKKQSKVGFCLTAEG